MKLIIGLGNPGKKYTNTRHNVGFRVIDALIKHTDATPVSTKADAELFKTRDALYAKPKTFMNESGGAVRQLTDYYKMSAKELTIVYDDVDLPFGEIRHRTSGSAGGHKGMQSVIEQIGTDEISRLRIGIGSNHDAGMPAEDYVLQRFTPEEEQELPGVIERAVEELRILLTKESEG